MDADNKTEYLKLIELLCMLQILSELSKTPTHADQYKELSFKNFSVN